MLNRIVHPSPALVVSVLALVVALGGTGYAAAGALISSGDIKNSSIKGKDVKDDSLSGRDIAESTMAKVPAAGDADTVGGRSAGSLTVRCPAGTQLLTGSCFETSNRPAQDFATASKTCAAEQRRLPTFSELLGVSATVSLPTTMTSDLLTFSNVTNYVSYFPGGLIAISDLASATAFRCVASASN